MTTPQDIVTLTESGYFSKIMTDYLNQSPRLQPFYNLYPSLTNYQKQITLKANFPKAHREVLVTALTQQYQNINTSPTTLEYIASLSRETTFTVTTGHQLNLFTGPLYFVYKIASVINTCKQLKSQYPKYDFVPVYWMATEDHDFQEINHFELKGKKISWNTPSGGPVGRLSTSGLEEVYQVFEREIGISKNADYLKELFQNAYCSGKSLAEATRYLVNELFKDQGLVILDGDDRALKTLFIPTIEKELTEQSSHQLVSQTIARFPGYSAQVNPREINLFYIEDNLRERIIKEGDTYLVNNTDIKFTRNEFLEVVHTTPEKISPNVILRPVYQETILPNLAYIGGGGELAYWLELQSTFEAYGLVFPMLQLRNSAVVVSEKQNDKRVKLNLSFADLFSKQQDLLHRKTQELTENPVDFGLLKAQLIAQFDLLEDQIAQTDPSFKGAVSAQRTKQLKGLDNLEHRYHKANRRKHHEVLERITSLQNELFPNQSLQERKANFSQYYERPLVAAAHKHAQSYCALQEPDATLGALAQSGWEQ